MGKVVLPFLTLSIGMMFGAGFALEYNKRLLQNKSNGIVKAINRRLVDDAELLGGELSVELTRAQRNVEDVLTKEL